MPRNIDAEKLMMECLSLSVCEGYEKNYIAAMYDRIKNAPTTDVEPVVHCKDCKFVHGDFRHIKCRMNFNGNGDEREVAEEHYCGYGAKMDGGK